MRTQEVLFNVTGQSWFYDPPEGRPDASPAPTVTVVLNMSGDNVAVFEAATTGSCAIDTVNTNTTADAAIGAQQLALTSVSGVTRGRRYLIANANGDR